MFLFPWCGVFIFVVVVPPDGVLATIHRWFLRVLGSSAKLASLRFRLLVGYGYLQLSFFYFRPFRILLLETSSLFHRPLCCVRLRFEIARQERSLCLLLQIFLDRSEVRHEQGHEGFLVFADDVLQLHSVQGI